MAKRNRHTTCGTPRIFPLAMRTAHVTSTAQRGRVIDPAQKIDATLDILVDNGVIAAMGVDAATQARHAEVVDCSGKLVLPGLIDTHGHVYQYVTGRFGLNADQCGVQSGVTTLVDQGGPSCITIPGFRHYVAERSATRVLAFISAYLVGGSKVTIIRTCIAPTVSMPMRPSSRSRPIRIS